jgi:hypothetical protein
VGDNVVGLRLVSPSGLSVVSASNVVSATKQFEDVGFGLVERGLGAFALGVP